MLYWKYEKDFRKAHPQTVGETDQEFDLDNYREFLEKRLEEAERERAVDGETSDGYHTFNELYEFRKIYNATLFNEWARLKIGNVHKSKKHYDGEACFGGGWFIVAANLPVGQISNHYELKDWDLFQIPEKERALFEFDGHTSKDVLARLKKWACLHAPGTETPDPESGGQNE